uniref:Uncharacterized protein n=1 Tax=Chelydra serpentina TaxID=8475 RepID=A0A8C3SEK2_CHESE
TADRKPFLEKLGNEVTCSICLDLFREPVTIECGHSFCRECITQLCEEEDVDSTCPLCKKRFQKRNLRPNRELKNIVECLSSQTVEKRVGGNMCKKHQEPLKFYCKEDQIPICVVCERSLAHRAHMVVPMEEAVQEHRVGNVIYLGELKLEGSICVVLYIHLFLGDQKEVRGRPVRSLWRPIWLHEAFFNDLKIKKDSFKKWKDG